MLTASQQLQHKTKIEKKILRLQEDIVYLKEATQPISPENAIGRVSRMDAINNKSVAENSLRMSEETLIRLKEAYENINTPEFGLCQKCKKDIEFERLLFMPESRRCTPCAKQST